MGETCLPKERQRNNQLNDVMDLQNFWAAKIRRQLINEQLWITAWLKCKFNEPNNESKWQTNSIDALVALQSNYGSVK